MRMCRPQYSSHFNVRPLRYRLTSKKGAGRIKYSCILRLVQKAAAAASSAADNARDNERVGYWVDEGTGFLRYSPTKSINMAFFATSMKGKKGKAVTKKGVATSTQAKIEEAAEEMKKDLALVSDVIDAMDEQSSSSEEPEQQLDRRRRSKNVWGVIVTSPAYMKALQDSAQKKAKAVDDKEKAKDENAAKFNRRWYGEYLLAEAALAATAAGGGSTRLTPLKVKHLKALIAGKTGAAAKAKNNKDGVMKAELKSVLHMPLLLSIPPGNGEDDEDQDEEEKEEQHEEQEEDEDSVGDVAGVLIYEDEDEDEDEGGSGGGSRRSRRNRAKNPRNDSDMWII